MRQLPQSKDVTIEEQRLAAYNEFNEFNAAIDQLNVNDSLASNDPLRFS